MAGEVDASTRVDLLALPVVIDLVVDAIALAP